MKFFKSYETMRMRFGAGLAPAMAFFLIWSFTPLREYLSTGPGTVIFIGLIVAGTVWAIRSLRNDRA